MKNSISKIIIGLIVLIIGFGILICYNKILNKEMGMQYKFENDKLFVSIYSDEWIEVPYDFSDTIEYLEENNNSRFREGTYQMTDEKIIFYAEQDISKIKDNNDNTITNLEQNAIINLIYSDNLGKDWKKIELGTVTSSEAIISINFENKDKGKIMVKNNEGNTEIYITDDGGENWSVEQEKNSNIERVFEDEPTVAVSNSNTEPGTCVYKAFNVLDTEELHIDEFTVSNGLYLKKIVSYDEYLKYKNMWRGIRELTQEDFINYYLILIVDKNPNKNKTYTFQRLLVEDDCLSLNIMQRDANINEKQSCIASGIAIVIPNRTDFEEDKINIVLNSIEENDYGWTNTSINGLEKITENQAIETAKQYAKDLSHSNSLYGQYLKDYTKVYSIQIKKAKPNNYWLITEEIITRQLKQANYERDVYEVVLVSEHDEVEIERAYFYVDAYENTVIAGDEKAD